MPNPSFDSLSTDGSSRLPLEILLPVSASLLISLAMTAYFAHRIRQKRLSRSKQFASSPSVLVLSDPEVNRQWLLDLSRLKDLGLDQMRKAKRACSLNLDVKRSSLRTADADPTFFGLPTRPRSIFLPGGRSRSSRAVIRQSWVQNLLRSSYDRLIGGRSYVANEAKIAPEIRITVPSMAADDGTALPQDRRWSQIIARDIGLSLHDVSKPEASDVSASRASDRSSHGNSRQPEHPPNSMDTLPSPARRRLSCVASAESCPKQISALCNHFRTLSPIKETCESLNVYNSSSLCSVNKMAGVTLDEDALPSKSPEDQDAPMSSHGHALLSSSNSLRSTNTGPSDTQISRDSPYSEDVAGGSQDHAMPAEQQSETQPGFYPVSSAGPIQEPQQTFSPFRAYDSGHITLSDMSVDSPSVAMTWIPQARHFVCNPDISMPCSSSAASLRTSILDSDQSPFPMPLIPSAFVDSSAPRSSSQESASPIFVPKSDGSGSLVITNREESPQRLSKSLAGVELWVDEDTDLFYYPDSVGSRT